MTERLTFCHIISCAINIIHNFNRVFHKEKSRARGTALKKRDSGLTLDVTDHIRQTEQGDVQRALIVDL